MDDENRERLHKANDYLTFSKVCDCERTQNPKKSQFGPKMGILCSFFPLALEQQADPRV